VTLYRRADCLLAANPMGRHSIGDRTQGLHRDPDGGLSIAIQAQAPADESNWLPAPEEPFYLVLRLYQPRRAHTEPTFAYPPVVRVDNVSCSLAVALPLNAQSRSATWTSSARKALP